MAIESQQPGGVLYKTQGMADDQLEKDLLNAVAAFNARRAATKKASEQ